MAFSITCAHHQLAHPSRQSANKPASWALSNQVKRSQAVSLRSVRIRIRNRAQRCAAHSFHFVWFNPNALGAGARTLIASRRQWGGSTLCFFVDFFCLCFIALPWKGCCCNIFISHLLVLLFSASFHSFNTRYTRLTVCSHSNGSVVGRLAAIIVAAVFVVVPVSKR